MAFGGLGTAVAVAVGAVVMTGVLLVELVSPPGALEVWTIIRSRQSSLILI